MKKLFLIAVFGLIATSCSTINTQNSGMLFVEAKSSTMIAQGTAANKMGEACTQGIIGIVTGDSSLEAAMKAGNITKVSFVDHKA